jgi:hypothetical protein
VSKLCLQSSGLQKLVQVSITLETSESIDQQYIHPSRRGSPTITRVHFGSSNTVFLWFVVGVSSA